MSSNPAYVAAEQRLFEREGLRPTVRDLHLPQPRWATRAVEVGAGEPALFLHGWGLCTAHWAPLVAQLPGVRSLMLDLPGHGTADAVDFRGVALQTWFTRMLTGCLDALELEAAHVVGHSQGAMFALWLALAAPERVRSVVAIGVPAVAFGATLEALRFLTRPLLGPLLLAVPVPPPAYRNIMAGSMGRAAVQAHPDLVRATYRATHRPGYATTTANEMRELFRDRAATQPRYVLTDDELQRLTQPVLVLWGAGDTRFQPIEEARVRAALLPHGRFELVAGGHEPWLDDPATCAGLMSAFLSRSRPVSS